MQYKIIISALLIIASFGGGIAYVEHQEDMKASFQFSGKWMASSEFTHLENPYRVTSQAYISESTALFHDYYNTLYQTSNYYTSTERTLFQFTKYRLAMRLEMQQYSKEGIPKPRHNLAIASFVPLKHDQFFIKYNNDNDEPVYFLYQKQN
uniref:hypothetical protein n=1 Tax=Thaumasiovibrio occultus TaxID=1891184 RepID=UPI000B3500CE|nr:hypothetical protein [Thaumasiovibrio occultus]